jgi:hypothetical protein
MAARGIQVPASDNQAPAGVVHLGLGAFHRAHQALVFGSLLDGDDPRWGVLGVSMRNPALADVLASQQGLYSVQIASASGRSWHIGGAIRTTCLATRDRAAVVQALAARTHRIDRLRDELHEALRRGLLLVSTSGVQVGQVNGLAYSELGELRFAYPMRITATARLGDGELLDIERESALGGPVHSKGVMILAAFLASRYAQELPLSLAASLVFEQSYGPVEGDSASLAELCALLSVLAVLPVRQSVAVTGSINQFGQVQAVGGINEKVEGFFDLCLSRGLQAGQGVVIPRANVQHLMLREDVVEAVRTGTFQVWAVEDADQAIELLTGTPAGSPDAKGQVPVGSVNHRVATQLTRLSVVRQAWGALGEGGHAAGGAKRQVRRARPARHR